MYTKRTAHLLNTGCCSKLPWAHLLMDRPAGSPLQRATGIRGRHASPGTPGLFFLPCSTSVRSSTDPAGDTWKSPSSLTSQLRSCVLVGWMFWSTRAIQLLFSGWTRWGGGEICASPASSCQLSTPGDHTSDSGSRGESGGTRSFPGPAGSRSAALVSRVSLSVPSV